MTVREDEEPGLETRRTLPPALPPEAAPVEVTATAARFPGKTRVAAVAAMLFVLAVQLVWIVALVYWIVRRGS